MSASTNRGFSTGPPLEVGSPSVSVVGSWWELVAMVLRFGVPSVVDDVPGPDAPSLAVGVAQRGACRPSMPFVGTFSLGLWSL